MSNPRREQKNQLPAAQLPNLQLPVALRRRTSRNHRPCYMHNRGHPRTHLLSEDWVSRDSDATRRPPPHRRSHFRRTRVRQPLQEVHLRSRKDPVANLREAAPDGSESNHRQPSEERRKKPRRHAPRGRNPRQPGDARHTPTEPHQSGFR